MQRLAVTAAAAGVVVGLAASGDDGPVLCLFRRCTGGYCPGCGLTRAAGRLVRGDVAGAWHQHPFLLVAVVEAAVIAGLWARRRHRRPASDGTAPRSSGRTGGPWLPSSVALANLGLLVAIWAVRLALGAIPVPFA